MLEKIKIETSDIAHYIGVHAGLVAMSAAVATGFIEIATHERRHALVPQTAIVAAGPQHGAFDNLNSNSEQRREHREEVHPHGSSYGASQRTPGRAGRA